MTINQTAKGTHKLNRPLHAQVMVPAGVKAFAAPTRGPRAHQYLGSADTVSPAAITAGAALESSHRVTSALGTGVLAQIDRLEVKEMRQAAPPTVRPPAPAPAPAAAAAAKTAAAAAAAPPAPLPPRATYQSGAVSLNHSRV